MEKIKTMIIDDEILAVNFLKKCNYSGPWIESIFL